MGKGYYARGHRAGLSPRRPTAATVPPMRTWLCLAVFALGCTRPHAPTPPKRGMLAGVVRDALSGAGVAGAIIVLRPPGEIAPVSEPTTGDGTYMIPDLPAGPYQVRAYRDKRLIGERDTVIRGGEVVGLDFTLAPAGVDVPDPNAPGAPELWRFRAADADPTLATIEGTVADARSHRRVADAVVSITLSGTLTTTQVITDEAGRYRAAALPPGSYDVSAYYTVLQRGQLEVKRNQVEVAGGETVVVPLWLETDPL